MESKTDAKIKTENKSIPAGWYAFIAGMIVFNLIIFAPPLILAGGNVQLAAPFYFALGFTCHQLDSRSMCYYPNGGANMVGDCTVQDGKLYYDKNMIVYSAEKYHVAQPDFSPLTKYANAAGYKIPVCARDIGIYLAMLIGGIAWPFLKKSYSQIWPSPKWLILSMIPIAIDGTSQYLGMRESTNLLRLITGGLIGFVIAFYVIPIMNQLINPLFEKTLKKAVK